MGEAEGQKVSREEGLEKPRDVDCHSPRGSEGPCASISEADNEQAEPGETVAVSRQPLR
jgi:hypothetical protein